MDGFQKVFELSKAVDEFQIIPENLYGVFVCVFFLREERKHRVAEGGEKKTRDWWGQEAIFHLPYNFLMKWRESHHPGRDHCACATWVGGTS